MTLEQSSARLSRQESADRISIVVVDSAPGPPPPMHDERDRVSFTSTSPTKMRRSASSYQERISQTVRNSLSAKNLGDAADQVLSMLSGGSTAAPVKSPKPRV